MKALAKRRVTAPLLSAVPFIIESVFTVLIMLVFAVIFGSIPENDQFHLFILAAAGIIGCVCACSLVKNVSAVRFGSALKFRKFDFSVPIMLALFTFAAGEIFDQLDGLLLSDFMTADPNRNTEFGLYGVIMSVVCAPIFEEIMFRFCCCELGRGAYRMPVICIASGLFFAAVHLYNIQGTVNVFIGGVCAAYVYCKTRNILYTMLEHAIHNAVCFIPYDSLVYYEKNGFVLSRWWWFAINVVIFVLCIVWYVKVFRRKYRENYFEVDRETGLPYSGESSVQPAAV